MKAFSYLIAFGILALQLATASAQASESCKFEGFSNGYFRFANRNIACSHWDNCTLSVGAKKIKEKIEALGCGVHPRSRACWRLMIMQRC